MTDLEKGEKIAKELFWQPAEGHNYYFRFAMKKFIRYTEGVGMEPEQIRLLVEYLKGETIESKINLLGKEYDLGEGWVAYDAWFQTVEEKWNGTDSKKIRIYQILVLPSEEGAEGDGWYEIEKGFTYKVSHKFFWDVTEPPAELEKAENGTYYKIVGLARDRETGLYSYTLEKRESLFEFDKETKKLLNRVVAKEHELEFLEHRDRTTELLNEEAPDPNLETEIEVVEKEDGDVCNRRRLTRQALLWDQQSGLRELRTVKETSKPYKKEIKWKDNDSAQLIIVFRNLEDIPNVTGNTFLVDGVSYTITGFSPSITVNKFGLFDGTLHYVHNEKNTGSWAATTAYNETFTYKFQIRGIKAGGRIVNTTYSVTKGICFGAATTAINVYKNGSGGKTPMDYPHLGLRASLSTSGQTGNCTWYASDLKVEKEEEAE